MSGHKKPGQVPNSAPTTETPAEPLNPVPVAPDTVVTETPVGVLPTEPFEPPLPVPPVDPAAGTEAAREQLERLGADQKKLEEDRQNLENEREALANGREKLEKDREALRTGTQPRTPREPRLIEVKALRGVIDPLKVQHREPGAVFRMREDLAEELEDRGDVEIVEEH
jgi:hypothetical protein